MKPCMKLAANWRGPKLDWCVAAQLTDRVEVDIGLLRGAMSRFDEYHPQVKALQEIARTIEVAARKTIEAPGGGIGIGYSGSGSA